MLLYTFAAFVGVTILPTTGRRNVEVADVLWTQVPEGWVFRRGRGGGSEPLVENIRRIKRVIQVLVEERIRVHGLDSLPNVHDLSNFGVGNANTPVDWFLSWERHAVRQVVGFPTGPDLVDESGEPEAFGRLGTPWDARRTFFLGEPGVLTFPVETAVRSFRDSAGDPIRDMEATELIRRAGLRPIEVSGIDVRRLGFATEPAVEEPSTPLRHNGFDIVRLEGYLLAASQPGTTELQRFRNSANNDDWTTSSSDLASLAASGFPGPPHREGFIFDLDHPQPGTIPLITWFSSTRNDHLTSADFSRFVEGNPYDAEGVLERAIGILEPDYARLQLEGYIYPPNRRPPAGSVPLYRWFDAAGRNFLTTSAEEFRLSI